MEWDYIMELIENGLNYDALIDEMEPPQELYEKIVNELKRRGTWRADNPGD